ncbi:SH2 domain-containing adapter protein E [Kryptolebias marmoratus]|uniref:SH2 domain-containing adapter protein E n=1 Tax=Kryptolebias marmoratus TaxID=37003 RepID=A0A3Q3AFY6_KRYMA|nr:SH2 domain-containing adapter protein E [Kryptolebias marmoratus]
MAKWFKEFPMTLKNGTDRTRSESNRTGLVIKTTGHRKGSCADGAGGRGVGSLLSGKSRQSSEPPNGTGASSQKDGKAWDHLLSGKSRRSPAEDRPPRTCPPVHAYISRMVRVDKQDRNGTSTCPAAPEAEKPAQCRTEPPVILEDYADPFDAQRSGEQRDTERLGENDGYVEPYDAQQMITEIRRRGSKDLLKVCVMDGSEGAVEEAQPAALQIYDLPHEGSGDNGITSGTRPELELELPWEWRKEHIVRTLSAQFDNPTKDGTSHSKIARQAQQPVIQLQQHPGAQLQQHQHLKQKGRSQKILRSSLLSLLPPSVPNGSSEGEACCVDPSLPLEKQSWYHGCMSRQEAELQLQPCREASFLVRNSESDSSKYSIALKTSQGCVHIIVAQTKGNSFTLDQSSCVFPSIPQVVHHYCTQRLPFNGAEHMTLLHPVPRIH